MQRVLPVGVAVAAVLLLSCAGAAVQPLLPGGHHVLFIGNSLTYTNDLPAMVADLASSAGDTVRTSTVAEPDFALIDHLNGGSDALARIRSDRWEYVVLQQGSSSLPANQDSLKLWTTMFAPYIRAAGARPALFMVWPTSDRVAFFDDVRHAYQNAALAVNGAFFPAGEAWRQAWTTNDALRFYSADGLHPTPLGSLAAALVIAECVTKRDARSFPLKSVVTARAGADTATMRLLESAAHAANAQYQGCG